MLMPGLEAPAGDHCAPPLPAHGDSGKGEKAPVAPPGVMTPAGLKGIIGVPVSLKGVPTP